MSFLVREEESLVASITFKLRQNCRPGWGADLCEQWLVCDRSLEKLLRGRFWFEHKNKMADTGFLQSVALLCVGCGCCLSAGEGAGQMRDREEA